VQVEVDVEKLRARGLTIDDVRQALKQQNIELPEGRLDQGSRELTVRMLGRMAAVPHFNELIVGNFGGQPIFLRDVAKVSDGIEEPRSLARLNGENSVTVIVRKQSGVNTVAVIDRVKARLAESFRRISSSRSSGTSRSSSSARCTR
jgi:HAE1 family hydrophobic/amphiphilic exporter-1